MSTSNLRIFEIEGAIFNPTYYLLCDSFLKIIFKVFVEFVAILLLFSTLVFWL